MAEQWQALAVTANTALAQASFSPHGPFLRQASAELGFRRLQMYLLAGGTIAPSQSVDTDGPTAMLRNASLLLAAYNERHNRAVRVLSIYGGTLGVLTDAPLWQRNLAADPNAADPRWQRWAQRRGDALQCTDQASQRLRSVAAYDLATVDAFVVARSFCPYSPTYHAWIRAAEKFAVRAVAEAGDAFVSERIMSSAVGREYLVGLAICNPECGECDGFAIPGAPERAWRPDSRARPAHAAPSSMHRCTEASIQLPGR